MSVHLFANSRHPQTINAFTARENAMQSVENLRQFAITLFDYAESDDCIEDLRAQSRTSAERIFLKAKQIEDSLTTFVE
jgi:hypothetical protein